MFLYRFFVTVHNTCQTTQKSENSCMSKLPLDFTQPPPLPETLEESHQVILTLWEAIRQLQIWKEELEEQLNNGSDNSSAPPSQDSPKNARNATAKPRRGVKKGRRRATKSTNGRYCPKTRSTTSSATIRMQSVVVVEQSR
ncbi:DUF6444 domain-containing protein [methane-oxidizing endosymbiont of Gigantopelta aegis]|uniref:DUF6444 domain-containing protein n=2 Tax=methane-oxidizing endosymbiont of Gigantopelta aegis TaxID=2794938 RepID=UPI003CCA5719